MYPTATGRSWHCPWGETGTPPPGECRGWPHGEAGTPQPADLATRPGPQLATRPGAALTHGSVWSACMCPMLEPGNVTTTGYETASNRVQLTTKGGIGQIRIVPEDGR
ncbi:MAG: hypothetical protein MUD01_02950 [Chloroflexaceae bacterium]|nr:hypothetical protein [Chloroflexaceae bacterium]